MHIKRIKPFDRLFDAVRVHAASYAQISIAREPFLCRHSYTYHRNATSTRHAKQLKRRLRLVRTQKIRTNISLQARVLTPGSTQTLSTNIASRRQRRKTAQQRRARSPTRRETSAAAPQRQDRRAPIGFSSLRCKRNVVVLSSNARSQQT